MSEPRESRDPNRDPDHDPRAAAEVFYDGGCPVCRREMDTYRGMAGADRVCWTDLTSDAVPEGADREAMMARMHVRRADGSMATGAAAFVATWRAMPRLAWLGRLLDRQPFLIVLEGLYRLHLRLRPLWRRG